MSALCDLDRPRIERMSDLFLWADYLEILCLSQKDREITLNALDEFLNPDKGLFVDTNLDDDIGEELEGAPESERLFLKYSDLTRILSSRASMFGDCYPFEFKADIQTLFLKSTFEDFHILYFFLLFAGNLRLLRVAHRHLFTTDFERVGTDALMKLFPAPWEWRHFGTANHPSISAYSGSKIEKLRAICGDINACLLASEQDFAPTDSKDAGFDFVCWYPFNEDMASHIPLIFAQSGCTADKYDLYDKQRSISTERIRNFFGRISCYGIMVTPGCFRNANGGWPSGAEVTSVFIDRPRIIALLKDDASIVHELPSYSMVSSILR